MGLGNGTNEAFEKTKELGAVLTQTTNGINHVIAYASRDLNNAVTILGFREKMFSSSMGD